MKHRRNWIIGILISTTATFVALQNVSAPTQEGTSTDTEIPITETVTLAYEGCAFSWAYHNAPELTEKLDAAVKELNPEASATATLFGEDCIRGDGSTTFGVMETDFSVKLPVDDLSKHEEFGAWIKDVMQIITGFAEQEIQGNDGFVEFWFEKSEIENIVFRVSLPAYLNEAEDKTGLELFNMYYSP
jgi:hypothetical protein